MKKKLRVDSFDKIESDDTEDELNEKLRKMYEAKNDLMNSPTGPSDKK